MKSTSTILIILGVVFIGLVAYAALRSNKTETASTYKSSDQQGKPASSNPASRQTSEPIRPDTAKTPEPDVSEKFNLGTGNFETKIVNARKGQQVSLWFEASFEDEIRVDGYDIKDIYVLPLSEHSVQFAADKTGEFRIYLVKRNKTIGTLIVK